MPSLDLSRWGGPAMILGGLLWILAYMMGLVVGMTTGVSLDDPNASPLARLGAASFSGAIILLGTGLYSLGARLRGHSNKLGLAGMALASVAVLTAAVNFVLLTGVLGGARVLGELGGIGVISILGGSILLAIAALRAKVLPRWARVVLLIAGVVTFPVILATIPLEAVLPDYVIANLPFPIVGAALAVVGYAMLTDITDRTGGTGRPVPIAA